jgi:brefeldin A-inhibited guanine nucleotide-exchange protein
VTIFNRMETASAAYQPQQVVDPLAPIDEEEVPSSSVEPSSTGDDDSNPIAEVDTATKDPAKRTMALLQNDAFLLLRSLCKLSMKSLPSDHDVDVGLRSKLFSLVLLNGIVAHSGSVFRTDRRFVAGVRTYLIQSLLKNCVSTSMSVFNLSLQLFTSVQQSGEFRAELKSELGVWLDSVLLGGIVQSSNSSWAHKLAVLRMLCKTICLSPDALADLFINYDCAVDDDLDVYTHMCKALELAANTLDNPPELRLEALACMDAIVKSLITLNERMTQAAKDDLPSSTPHGRRNNSEMIPISSAFERRQLVAADLQAGGVKFNLKPKSGIAYLHEKGLVDSTNPLEVAKWLMTTKGLDKRAMGDGRVHGRPP